MGIGLDRIGRLELIGLWVFDIVGSACSQFRMDGWGGNIGVGSGGIYTWDEMPVVGHGIGRS